MDGVGDPRIPAAVLWKDVTDGAVTERLKRCKTGMVDDVWDCNNGAGRVADVGVGPFSSLGGLDSEN